MLFLVVTGTTFAQKNTEKQLDSVMQAYTDAQQFNGTVLVAKGGKILLHKGYGKKSFKTDAKNDERTVFMIASVTKQFTAILILKMIEQGKIALTDDLTKFYPDFPDGKKITIYNLLTHTSGLHNFTLDSAFMRSNANRGKTPPFSQMLMRYKKLDFEPGSRFNYSNQGYQLLGEIIEKVSGMTYYQAMRKYVFSPLKMNNSGFDFANLKSTNKATGYWTYPLEPNREEASIIDSAESFSAGNIYSTVGDLYKWYTGLSKYKVVNKTLLDKAYTPFKNNYGFGMFIDSLFGLRTIHHSGDTYGFKSNLVQVPNDDVCIVLLNNVEDLEMPPIARNLLAVLYNQPIALPRKRQAIAVSQPTLKKYEGSYQFAPGFSIRIKIENGHLWVYPGQQPAEMLYAERENFFFSKNQDVQLEFTMENADKVSSATLYQGGRTVKGNKVQ